MKSENLSEDVIVRKHIKLVRGVARRFYLVGAEQEDVIQEGMIGLLKAVREYKDESGASFETFATLCIKRQILKAVNIANRQKSSPLNLAESLEFIENGNYNSVAGKFIICSSPEDEIIDKEKDKSRKEKMAKLLSPMEKKVLKYYLEGQSYGEIAGNLSLTKKSIDNAIQRIRKKLDTKK